jgi:hypothetical protein
MAFQPMTLYFLKSHVIGKFASKLPITPFVGKYGMTMHGLGSVSVFKLRHYHGLPFVD